MLSVDHLTFAFGEKPILKELSLTIEEGEIVSLIGVSGSGKTTLFRLITGLLSPQGGSILIEGAPLPEGAQKVTYMRQEDLLLPWRTVMGNLMLLSELGGKVGTEEEALSLLGQVGLDGQEEAYPSELSGGMRQRVSLARALLQRRPLLLLDEPFGSLDVLIREQLYTLLRQIRQEMNKTLLFVTHDFRDALALSDRILVLVEGSIVESFEVTEGVREDPRELTQKIRERLAGLATA